MTLDLSSLMVGCIIPIHSRLVLYSVYLAFAAKMRTRTIRREGLWLSLVPPLVVYKVTLSAGCVPTLLVLLYGKKFIVHINIIIYR